MIYDNLITLALIVGMFLVIVSTDAFEKHINHLFLAYTVNVFFLVLADMADYTLKNQAVLSPLRYLSSAVGYTLRPAILALIISILLRNRKQYIVLWVPILVQAGVAFTTPLTHWMFWFDTNNNFYRGPLGYLCHVISGFYMVALLVLTLRSHYDIDPSEIMIVFYSVSICAAATIVESMVNVKFILPGAMMVAISIYYLSLYTQIYKRDTLTGVLNRRSFFLDAKKWDTKSMAVVSMDLNGLKDINDTQGHAAGDVALKTLCAVSRKAAGKQFRLYRTGGDEFMLLGVGLNERQAQDCIARIQTALQPSGYMAAIGYAIYQTGANFDEICHAADMRMYEDKRHYRHRERAADNCRGGEPARI